MGVEIVELSPGDGKLIKNFERSEILNEIILLENFSHVLIDLFQE